MPRQSHPLTPLTYLRCSSIPVRLPRFNNRDSLAHIGPSDDRSLRSFLTKPGGKSFFYPICGWWTKLHAKYLLRPITKRLDHDRLLALIDSNVDRMMTVSRLRHPVHLGPSSRPLTNERSPKACPMQSGATGRCSTPLTCSRLSMTTRCASKVAQMFERHGPDVSFAGFVEIGTRAAVVKGVKRVRTPSRRNSKSGGRRN